MAPLQALHSRSDPLNHSAVNPYINITALLIRKQGTLWIADRSVVVLSREYNAVTAFFKFIPKQQRNLQIQLVLRFSAIRSPAFQSSLSLSFLRNQAHSVLFPTCPPSCPDVLAQFRNGQRRLCLGFTLCLRHHFLF